MATFARSRKNLNYGTQPTVSKASTTRNAVAKYQPDTYGTDINSVGAMAGAFGKFFGNLVETGNTMEETAFIRKREEIRQENNDQKNEGVRLGAEAAIQQKYGYNDVDVAMGDLVSDSALLRDRDFTETFREAYAKNMADRLVMDAQNYLTENNFHPKDVGAQLDAFYASEIANGVGDPIVDGILTQTYMDWATETSMKATAQAKTLEIEAGIAEVNNAIVSSVQNKDFSFETYRGNISAIQTLNPRLTTGEAASLVLSKMSEVAGKSRKGVQEMLAFLDRKGADAETNQSYADMFPDQVAQVKEKLNQQYAQSGGFEAGEKYRGLEEKLAKISTTTNARDQINDLLSLQVELEQTVDQYGAPAAFNQLNGQIETKLIAAAKDKANYNVIALAAKGQNVGPVDQAVIEKYQHQFLVGEHDFKNDPSKTASFAVSLETMMRTTGNKVSGEVVSYLEQGLLSNQVGTRQNTMAALNSMSDGHRAIVYNKLSAEAKQAFDFTKRSGALTDPTSEEIRSAVELVPSIEALIDPSDLDGLKGDAKKSAISNELLDGVDTLVGVAVGVDDGFFDVVTDAKLSPVFTREFRKRVLVEAQNFALVNGYKPSLDQIKAQVAKDMAKSAIVTPDNFISIDEGNSDYTELYDGTQIVPLGRAVGTPTGNVEDTAANVAEAIDDLSNGLVGFVVGDEDADSTNIVARPDPALKKHNGYALYKVDPDTSNVSTEPLHLVIGQNYEGEVITKNGQRINFWGDRVFGDEPLFGPKIGSDLKFSLNGDEKHDQAILDQVLHPGVKATKVGNRYILFAVPYFKESFMTNQELEKRAREQAALPNDDIIGNELIVSP